MQAALGDERVEVQQGAFLQGRGGDGEIDSAVHACERADVCVVVLGLSAINPKATFQVAHQAKRLHLCLVLRGLLGASGYGSNGSQGCLPGPAQQRRCGGGHSLPPAPVERHAPNAAICTRRQAAGAGVHPECCEVEQLLLLLLLLLLHLRWRCCPRLWALPAWAVRCCACHTGTALLARACLS